MTSKESCNLCPFWAKIAVWVWDEHKLCSLIYSIKELSIFFNDSQYCLMWIFSHYTVVVFLISVLVITFLQFCFKHLQLWKEVLQGTMYVKRCNMTIISASRLWFRAASLFNDLVYFIVDYTRADVGSWCGLTQAHCKCRSWAWLPKSAYWLRSLLPFCLCS